MCAANICTVEETEITRRHNDANVLCLSGAMAELSARSLREPFSSSEVRNGVSPAAHLGSGQRQGTDSGLESSWFESVGVAIALDVVDLFVRGLDLLA